MTDAPERIWALDDRRKQWSETPPEEWSGHPTWHWSEYIRADLHQQALDAAREEGRRKGLEEAARVGPIPCYETRHVMLGDKVRNAIRALIDKPADPVAEAAGVLLNKWLDGEFEDGADAAADDAITGQWAHVDRTYPDASPVIEAWLRALAQKEEGQ